jgi:hypothetical protein
MREHNKLSANKQGDDAFLDIFLKAVDDASDKKSNFNNGIRLMRSNGKKASQTKAMGKKYLAA